MSEKKIQGIFPEGNEAIKARIEELQKEKELIRFRLDYAMERFYGNPSREAFHQICQEMEYVWIYNLIAECPTEFGNTGMKYKLFPTPDYCSALIVYTSPEKNPEMKEAETYGFLPWRSILSQAAEFPGSSGIVINPYSGHQAYVWLNPVYIRAIIQSAKETIAILEETEEVREALRNGI